MNLNNLQSILINENNINTLKSTDDNSWNIKRLLGVNLSQSQSIRFGNVFQQFIKDLVKSCGGEIIDQHFIDVYGVGSEKSNKGLKDIDIWFTYNGVMYYFEAKTNMDLDSEKSKATDNKVEDITNWIKNNNLNTEVVSGVISCWFTKEVGLPVKVKNVLFMEDLFKILNIDIQSSDYYDLMKKFGQSL
jgi:hypothetical protein